ncbi:hypothetical protein VNO80_28212 [Phaseolus coccineus]|uniref:Uncharacterized protein n=1 Tax=Phaseolus coccineus TaxID=3886 RepID=A0AAN9QHX1_PHACN
MRRVVECSNRNGPVLSPYLVVLFLDAVMEELPSAIEVLDLKCWMKCNQCRSDIQQSLRGCKSTKILGLFSGSRMKTAKLSEDLKDNTCSTIHN